MYVITVVGFALWTAYGVMNWQWPLIVPNAICLALSGFILAMKVMPRRQVEAVASALKPEN
jgi:MtN3 and saliva related transmembrane protein